MNANEDENIASINYGTGAWEDGVNRPQNAKTKKTGLICEVVVLIVTIGFAWMLLLLPINFYHLPDEVFRKVSTDHVQVNGPDPTVR